MIILENIIYKFSYQLIDWLGFAIIYSTSKSRAMDLFQLNNLFLSWSSRSTIIWSAVERKFQKFFTVQVSDVLLSINTVFLDIFKYKKYFKFLCYILHGLSRYFLAHHRNIYRPNTNDILLSVIWISKIHCHIVNYCLKKNYVNILFLFRTSISSLLHKCIIINVITIVLCKMFSMWFIRSSHIQVWYLVVHIYYFDVIGLFFIIRQIDCIFHSLFEYNMEWISSHLCLLIHTWLVLSFVIIDLTD